ncbi:MAG: type I restriction enzyme HsdR N-terminal domain-containing protein [Fermentimonas sp.]|jgi:hypothetical protein
MSALNLPPFEPKITKTDSGLKIFDIIRQKYVALTPEEWVRQHFINFLITEKNYPRSLMENEALITLNSQTKRCDTVVYNKHLKPLMIIEYKESNVPITQQVFDQIAGYNIELKVKYLIVTNGISHYCCRINYKKQTYTYLTEIPDYNDIVKK